MVLARLDLAAASDLSRVCKSAGFAKRSKGCRGPCAGPVSPTGNRRARRTNQGGDEMTANPAISLGMPVYNAQRYLAGAIQSVIDQTFEDWELIISDNASTDSTPAICSEFAERDPRIRFHRQERNVGAGRNHNFVAQQARAEYFKWTCYDDL